MLNLSKYELRKNRTCLIIILLGLALLELYFIISCRLQNQSHTGTSIIFLTFYGIICYFFVYLLAIVNYSKELSSKSSYLIFMTPNSGLKIILSKLFSILLIGIALFVLLVTFAILDYYILVNSFPELVDLQNYITTLLAAFNISISEFFASALCLLIVFLVSFFSEITLIYLSITLSSTLLQNNKFKWVLSIALFIILTLIIGYISDLLPVINEIDITIDPTLMQGETVNQIIDVPSVIFESIMATLPQIILSTVVMIGSIFGSSILLDKKVSL